MSQRPELICPAGSLPALKAAVDNGADAVYMGFRDATNARNFPGLNFDDDVARRAVEYAHARGAKVLVALNTYPQPDAWSEWTSALVRAEALGVDAVILADPGLLRHAARNHPGLRLHLSVQGSATSHEAIRLMHEQFGISRVVLPRVLSLSQVRRVIEHSPVEVEVFGFGSLCVMVEGRCALSSYVTGQSPNTRGVCSPAQAVRWEESDAGRRARLNGVLIDTYAPDEPAGYPTLCKGRFEVEGEIGYAFEEPASLSVLDMLPELMQAGVCAIKVEGRQRSPAYVAQITRVLRAAIDACAAAPGQFAPRASWVETLNGVSEGRIHTLGALDRAWQ